MNVILRPWQADDLDSLVKNANNPDVAKFMMNKFPSPYTEEDGKNFIAFASAPEIPLIKAIVVDEKAVGGIGLNLKEDIMCKNAEMGYWLGEDYWGKGIMSSVIMKMVLHGFENFDINRIFARPFGTNIGSQRVLEKAGFTFEGKFEKTIFKNGEYLDELFYAIRRSEMD
jgi:[ribosomal protein S5]-alanine N-acetyltransferase